MLTIKCAKCHQKIMKYQKIGSGNVLRCYKSKIQKWYVEKSSPLLRCECGAVIGKDCSTFYKMISSAFIFSGTKE